MNYLIVLFKNKKRKKIIKSFVRKNVAEKFFKNKIDESNKIKFNVEVENSEECKFELAIVSTVSEIQFDLFVQDDIGRNVKVEIEDDNFKILKISNYNLPEKIQDWSLNKRISFDEFFKKYFLTRDLKNVFSINNKIVIQQDEDVNLFSLAHIPASSIELYFSNITPDFLSKRFIGLFLLDVIIRPIILCLLFSLRVDHSKLVIELSHLFLFM